MNKKYINEALGNVGTDDLNEALSYRKRGIGIRMFTALAAALAVMIGAGVYLYSQNTKVQTSPSADISEYDGGSSTLITGGVDSNASLFPKGEFTRTGSAFTDEEIASLLDREKSIIANYVASETKDLGGELRISQKGYCYVQAYGNTIALDSMTLPVFTADNRIVGEVQLFRVDGEVHYSVAAGGPSWDRLTDIIAEHQGEKLAFVYVGSLIVDVIAPDNTVYPRLENSATGLDGVTSAFDDYAKQENTFCLADVVSAGSYVTVKL